MMANLDTSTSFLRLTPFAILFQLYFADDAMLGSVTYNREYEVLIIGGDLGGGNNGSWRGVSRSPSAGESST